MRYTAYADNLSGAMNVAVKSCGHIFARAGRTIDRPFGREDYLLFYIDKGAERFRLGGSEVTGEAGSFLLYRPTEPQEHVCVSDPAEFFYIHFIAPADFDLAGLDSSQVYHADPSTKIRGIFEEMIDELLLKQAFCERICALRLLELLHLLARRAAGADRAGRDHMDKIAAVVRTMNTELDRVYSLDDYAAMCSMSKFYFLRVFEGITGASPMEYRNELRIGHAREMLEDTCLPVAQIAEQLGYASASYFCDAFKKKVGVSPSQYRKSKAGAVLRV